MKPRNLFFTFAIFSLLLTACGAQPSGPISSPLIGAPSVEVMIAPTQQPVPDTVPLDRATVQAPATQPAPALGEKSYECRRKLAVLIASTVAGTDVLPVEIPVVYIDGQPGMEQLKKDLEICGYKFEKIGRPGYERWRITE